MEKVKQISVLLENRPGALARLSRLIADQKINLEGLMIAEAVGEGMVRLIPEDTNRLVRLLKQQRFRFVTDEVIGIDLSNRPGALAEASKRLGQAGVNIVYAYATGMTSSRKVMAIVKTSDQRKALQALRR
jgi:hypothetical protein